MKKIIVLILCLIVAFCNAQTTVVAGHTNQMENSVCIDRVNPNIVLISNNSYDWQYNTTPCGVSITHIKHNLKIHDAFGIDVFASYNGGNYPWDGAPQGFPPNHKNTDPTICIDSQNRWYESFVNGGMYVAYSTNYGTSWQVVNVSSAGSPDKSDIWIDNKVHQSDGSINLHQGNIYCGWSDGNVSYQPIKFSYSTSHGISWSAPIIISNDNNTESNSGVNIKTGPNGEVYACWAEYPCEMPPPGAGSLGSSLCDENKIAFASTPSFNGSNSFTIKTIPIAGTRTEAFQSTENMRHASFPVMAVNQLNGNIYIVWASNTGHGFQVLMTKSIDEGANFSTNLPVGAASNAGQLADQWEPWITCDETSGAIAVIYYATPIGFPQSVYTYVSYSYDEGETWKDKILSSAWNGDAVPSKKHGEFPQNNMAGDYLGIDLYEGQCVPGWSDNTTNNSDHIYGDCNGIGNMLAYTEPFSILCNPDPWEFCSTSSPNDYNISDYAFYRSNLSITAGGSGCPKFTIQPSGYCRMTATNSITLGPGFTAKAGCNFEASLSPCTPARIQNPNPSAPDNQPVASKNPQNNITPPKAISNILLMPNPTSGSVQVDIKLAPQAQQKEQKYLITIYNMLGQQIYQNVSNSPQNIVDLSGQPTGIYLVKVQAGGQTFYKKVMLEK